MRRSSPAWSPRCNATCRRSAACFAGWTRRLRAGSPTCLSLNASAACAVARREPQRLRRRGKRRRVRLLSRRPRSGCDRHGGEATVPERLCDARHGLVAARSSPCARASLSRGHGARCPADRLEALTGSQKPVVPAPCAPMRLPMVGRPAIEQLERRAQVRLQPADAVIVLLERREPCRRC